MAELEIEIASKSTDDGPVDLAVLIAWQQSRSGVVALPARMALRLDGSPFAQDIPSRVAYPLQVVLARLANGD